MTDSARPVPASPEALRALIEARRSVRRFEAEPVPQAIIRDCLELAMLAPNSCNLQPWGFHVVQAPALLAAMKPICLNQGATSAPLLIVVLARPDTWREACAQNIRDWPESPLPEPVRMLYERIAPDQYEQGCLGWRGLLRRMKAAFSRAPVSRGPDTLAQMRTWAVKSTALAAENLMLAFQSHGYSSCPLEGFDEVHLRRLLNIPTQAIPVMVLAVGRAAEGGVYGARMRFPFDQMVNWD